MVTLLRLVRLHGGICATEKKTAVHMDARSGGFCMQLAEQERRARRTEGRARKEETGRRMVTLIT